MSLESLIEDSGQLATITVEALDGSVPPQSAMGGVDRSGTWQQIATGVPCLLNNKNSQLMAWPGRNDARAQVFDTRIYFYLDPTPSGFTTRMRITVSEPGGGSGDDPTDTTDLGVYQVVSVNNPNSMDRIWQIDCEKVRN